MTTETLKGETIQSEETKSVSGRGLRPTSKPRFHRGDANGSMTAAVRLSAYEKSLVYLTAVQSGYQVSTKKPSLPKGSRWQEVLSTWNGKAYTVTRRVVTN